MKKIVLAISFLLFLLCIACEKQTDVYSYEHDMLNFDLGINDEDSLTTFTFVYHPDDTLTDTLWFDVTILGFLSEQDRPFELEQVKTIQENALPGVHYVPFDDAQLKEFYYIPANAVKSKIPIVLKRDPSLKEKMIRLSFTFKDNGVFRKGFEELSVKSVDITDRLSKPNYWDAMTEHYFGNYGPVKHQFMIDHSGKRWDDVFFVEELNYGDWNSIDQTYLKHLAKKFQNKLDEVNEERKKQNLGMLRDSDNSIIHF